MKLINRIGVLSLALSLAGTGGISQSLGLETGPDHPQPQERTRRSYNKHSRSKYTPHIGAKQRARHARWPDGPMHVTGHQRRTASDFPLPVAA